MRVTVIARALNESRFIDRFLQGYTYLADRILIADGGSSDDTIQKIQSWEDEVRMFGLGVSDDTRIEVRPFDGRILHPTIPGLFRNQMSANVQFLIDWALEDETPDWIIFDDVDCVPNRLLREQGRELLKTLLDTDHQGIDAHRLYLWGRDRCFPELHEVGPSLWGWRPAICNLHAVEDGNLHQQLKDIPQNPFNVPLPLCLLHTPWPDEAAWQSKKRWYESWGMPILYPPDSCGRLEPLPEWAVE